MGEADMESLMARMFFGGEGPGKVYIFHRADMFYPVELASDADAIENAHCNPGTTKITNWNGERLIWEAGDGH
jgi:hypothetical protein